MSELIDRQALLDSVYRNLPMIPSMAGMTAEEMRLRIAALIENAPTASPWHRVEEPPKEYGTYIVCWKDGEKFWWENADWDEDWCTEEPNWYSFRDSRATIIKPDYWMPIEPPKEDA